MKLDEIAQFSTPENGNPKKKDPVEALADEGLRELAAAARWVDRTAFKENADFEQAHQAMPKALDKGGRFV